MPCAALTAAPTPPSRCQTQHAVSHGSWRVRARVRLLYCADPQRTGLRVATRLRDGKRNERTDRWLCELLGIPYGEDDGQQAVSQGDLEDDYDEEDDSDVTSINSDEDSG